MAPFPHLGWNGCRSKPLFECDICIDRAYECKGVMITFRNSTQSAYDRTGRDMPSIRPMLVLNFSHFEATRLSATTGALELQKKEQSDMISDQRTKRHSYFAALGGGVGLLVLVGTHAKVLDSLTGVPLASQEDGVGTGRRTECELVQGQCLATGLDNAVLGSAGEAQCSNR